MNSIENSRRTSSIPGSDHPDDSLQLRDLVFSAIKLAQSSHAVPPSLMKRASLLAEVHSRYQVEMALH